MTWIKEEKLYLYIVLLLILIMAIRMPLDTDMWWHLRAGQETWENKQVYAVDTFSFTRQGESWINHSWLSQVLMYVMFQGGGFYSLSIWVGICAVASMVFVYIQMEGHPLLRSGILILTGTVSSVVWSPRPQVMSLVLFSLLSYLLYIYKRKGKIGVLVGIIPLFMIWGNLHGGYILGILLVGCFIGGSILNQLVSEDKTDQLSWKQIGLVSMIMVISLFAVLVNPFGFDMWRIPFNTIGVETLQNLVSEWSSPDFHQAFQQPMLFMLLAVICAVGLSKRQIDLFDLVSLVFFSWAALTARRNFGPFAIVAAPILAKHSKIFLDNWYSQNRKKIPIIEKFSQTAKTSNQDFNPVIRNLINSSILLLLLSVAVWKTITVNQTPLIESKEREIFPVDAVNWLKEIERPGNLLNEYNWGGYLIWELREYPVFVDGRTDLFGDEILGDYMALMLGQDGWQEIIAKYEISTMLVDKDSTLAKIAQLNGWKIEYADSVALILCK